ncbi:tRNA methyltransferase ppm2 [Aspergillus wentii]|nr:tRNA methyltransferase ppm2 [Aspergillus wentii]
MGSAKKPAATAGPSAKALREADLVMGTNNSSIVSKRSVEMLYYPKPHFFQYFVKKPLRRSPVINRGYWLRMYAMKESVRRFMKEPSDKPKFVLSLGCGFDPLPFMLLSAEGPLCRDTTFVDIDYEKLMLNKKTAIHGTPEITELLENVEFLPDESAVQVRSDRYKAIGCDLRNLKKLEDTLNAEVFPSSECSILCLAEVSLTYMDVKSAGAVVNWASKLSSDVQFCILEQFFPDGPNHPFASTMMKHFSKCGAPLHSIHEFPSLQEQEQRFKNADWAQVRARSLWDLWSDDDFLSPSTRISLDDIEPVDESEEFSLYASHYFLLHASTRQPDSNGESTPDQEVDSKYNASNDFKLLPHCPPGVGQRRFGVLIPDSEKSIGYHGGLGRQTRLATTDLYATSKETTSPLQTFPSRDISARMCHTATTLGNGNCLLVGGRTSPAAVLQDCWLRQDNKWSAVDSLATPRFRHSATKVTLKSGTEGVLIYGGKTKEGQPLDTWLLWSNNGNGWQTVETNAPKPSARFGACLGNLSSTSGVVFGGIGADRTVLEDFWTWNLSQKSDGTFFLDLKDITQEFRATSPLFKYINRFAATVNQTSWGLVIIGGIMPRQIIPHDKVIMLLDSTELLNILNGVKPWNDCLISSIGLGAEFHGPRPLLTGHASCATDPNQVLILGGGAVCFAFGTFWTEGTWLLKKRSDSTLENTWELMPESVQPIKDLKEH